MNPSIGQFLVLLKLKTKRKRISRFLGYDPVKDKCKVLCMTVLQVPSKKEIARRVEVKGIEDRQKS